MSYNSTPRRLPPWFKVRIRRSDNYRHIESLIKEHTLHTVCEGAGCPNKWECWNRGTATFMILGDACTRGCSFCGVRKGVPEPLDRDEPLKVAVAIRALKLKYAVITSVTRDDLPDGGAGVFASVIREVRRVVPECRIEVLIPDLKGSISALSRIVDASPDVIAHNVETVKTLYPEVRPGADFYKSLTLLRMVKALDKRVVTKSGIIIGFGEGFDEIVDTIRALHDAGCDILTIGQYLSPSKKHLPVKRFYTPEEFDRLSSIAKEIGFALVESGPLVRSSYHADLYTTLGG